MPDRFRHKEGSALVESCLVIVLLCLVLFGLLQASYVVSSRNVINYSSIAATRAAAVGFDKEMVKTVIHYATIPTAGPMVHPDPKRFSKDRPQGGSLGSRWTAALSGKNNPRSERGEYEVAMYKEFHGRDYPYTVMNFENWSDRGEARVGSDYDESDYDEKIIEITVSQKLPLTFPFARVFFGHLPLVEVDRDGKREEYPGKQIDSTSSIENHARFYLKSAY